MKILESNLDKILERIEQLEKTIDNRPKIGIYVHGYDAIIICYQILACLILETGSYLPEVVKQLVLESTDWEFDKKRGWRTDMAEVRKQELEKFRKKFLEHRPGKRHLLRDSPLHYKLEEIYFDNYSEKSNPGYTVENGLIDYLELNNCDLTEIPEKVFTLDKLKVLNLEDNKIQTVPKDIANLKNLEVLSLHNNQLQEIPEEIGELSKLKYLDLSYNEKLNTLPNSLWELYSLEILIMSETEFGYKENSDLDLKIFY